MGEIKLGCVARCSLGMLGLVTSTTKVMTRYGEEAWLGVQLSPDKSGQEWCSRNPTYVAASVEALFQLQTASRVVVIPKEAYEADWLPDFARGCGHGFNNCRKQFITALTAHGFQLKEVVYEL